jgi:hypothetical protein
VDDNPDDMKLIIDQIRVNLNLPIKIGAKSEAKLALRMVDGDRKSAIQAAIIRIMKAKRVNLAYLLSDSSVDNLP